MAILPLRTDPATGVILLPGRVNKELVAPFGVDTSTSLPSWITCTAGTATVVTPSATSGELQLASPSGGTGKITIGAPLLSSAFEAIWIQAEGVYIDGNVDHFNFGINQTNVGGATAYMEPAGNFNSYVAMNYSGGTENVVDIPTYPGLTTKQNLGFLMLPTYGHVYLTSDDQVLADIDFSGGSGSSGTLIGGAYQCVLAVIGKTGDVGTLHIEQLKLTTVSY